MVSIPKTHPTILDSNVTWIAILIVIIGEYCTNLSKLPGVYRYNIWLLKKQTSGGCPRHYELLMQVKLVLR